MFPQKAKSFLSSLFLVLIFGCKNMQPTPMDPMDMMPTGPDVPSDGMWRSIGPYGTDVTALTVCPSQPNVVMAASNMGEIYKSEDSGQSWRRTANVSIIVHTLAIHPTNPMIAYAGQDFTGVIKTEDGGVTWTTVNNGLQFDPFVWSLLIDPVNPDVVFAGSFRSLGQGGIYKSINGGQSWQNSNTGMPDGSVLSMAFHPDSSHVIYAGTFQGAGTIYKSTDSGATWTAINTGIVGNNIFEIVVDPQQSNTLYASTQTGGVFVSRNGGMNWEQVNTGLGRLDVRALVIDPVSPSTLYASGASGIFKTTDGGQNWQESNNSLTNPVIVKLAIDPTQPNRIYAGAVGTSNVGGRGSFLGGIFLSENRGNSWEFSSVGLASRDVRAIAIDPQDPFLIYAGTFGRGLFRSTDGGMTWNSAVESINLGLDNPQVLDIEIDPDDNTSLVVATFADGIYKTDNAGTNWRNVRQGGRFQEIVRDPVSTNILYAGDFADGVLKSTDNGETWTQTTFNIQRTFPMAIDPVNPSTIYVGVNLPEPDGGVYKSTDDGATWDKKSTGITNSLIRSLVIDPQNPDVIFAGSLRSKRPSIPPGIFKTIDGGENWQRLQPSIEFEPFVILINPTNTNEMYSSNLEGILKSSDGGVTWQFINDGLISTAVLAMAFDPTNPNIVYAGTRGDAVFRVGFKTSF